MKCQTLDQLTRVAAAGARKMNDEGYIFRLFPMSQVAGNVVKGDGTTYRVNTHGNTCSCPFYAANQHFGRAACSCKHLVWLRDELAYDADVARRDEEAAYAFADIEEGS